MFGVWQGSRAVHIHNAGSRRGVQKQGRMGPHGLNSAPLHQQMMRSSKTSTYVSCKSQHENQHFLNHHRQWTQQIMSGNSTNRAFCYHEQCQQAHYLHLLIHSNCKTSGCLTATCIFSKVWCTVVCRCEGGEACKNPLTRNQSDEEAVEPDEDTDE